MSSAGRARSRERPVLGRARAVSTLVGAALLLGGCGGPLLRLAKQQDWAELDRKARGQARPPRGKAARAWAQALVELGNIEEARAVLQRDFRHGGQEASLLALAELEREQGLLGMAAARYTRLLTIDLDALQASDSRDAACELLRGRARAELALGQAMAADSDMRRMALVCPAGVTDEDRSFLSSLRPQAQDEAEARRTLAEATAGTAVAIEQIEADLAEQLDLARKRGPRAVLALAAAADMQVEPDDVAMLLAAEFGGALGPGLVSRQRITAWIGDNDIDAVLAAIDTLPDGSREYALLRLAGVRSDLDVEAERQGWIVAAMGSLSNGGPQEAAKAWRVSAITGDLGGAEFALNTNLRDMIPVEPVPEPAPGKGGAKRKGEGKAAPGSDGPAPDRVELPTVHWSLRVPVDRRSFDLLLTLARLFEQRGQTAQALELRRHVLVAGHEVGLAQVSAAAVDEVRRALVLGHPWQALAIAEVVPGPLLDEILAVAASAIGLRRAAGLDEADEADRNVVFRVLGDPWFTQWDPRLVAALDGLDLGETARCPGLGRWLDDDAADRLRAVGLDPERSRAALEAAFAHLDGPETGAALVAAIESDLALSCSASLIELLFAGPHAVALSTLDERLIHAPELDGPLQLQLAAEVALAHGELSRATLLTISAAAQSSDPRALWARAAVAGRSFGGREYTLEALRELLMHSPGLHDEAARRELVLMRLRDVDGDDIIRSGDDKAIESLTAVLHEYVREAPRQRQWARLDRVLWQLAGETRADALAWSLLIAALVDDRTRRDHPEAVAALERAAMPAEGDAGGAVPGIPTVFLGDAASLCEIDIALADAATRIGAASTCDPMQRARALAALLADAPEQQRAALRSQILAGPAAIAIDPERPGVATTVPALARPGLLERVVFGLAIEPVFVVDAD